MKYIQVLKLGPILFLTIPENLNDALAQSLEEALLEQQALTKADAIVIDISSLEIIDSFMARVISETANASSLMDAKVIIVGMSPVATITLLELGMRMEHIETALDLEAALDKLGYALVKTKKTIHPLDSLTEPNKK